MSGEVVSIPRPDVALSSESLQSELATTKLKICLLGAPRVAWAGQAVSIPRRQARALFYYLAAHNQLIPRQQLCYLFWPDLPDVIARRSLSRLLTHLRRALPAPDLMVTTDDQVGLSPDGGWSDVVKFKSLCSIQVASHSSEALRQATALYQGSFLDGFSLSDAPEFDAWMTQERAVCERHYLYALMTVLEDAATEGQYDLAIDYARRFLAVDDLAEEVHRRLMELYAAYGDRSAALRQYEQCMIILERELGISPLPETREVYQSILDSPLPTDRLSTSTPSSPVSQSVNWTTLPSLEAPMVGRAETVCQLQQIYQHVRSGHGGLVFISGEPGIGKSRLMQDFTEKINDEATLIVVNGHEVEQAMPFLPLIEGLRTHLPAMDWAKLDIEPFYLQEIMGLLPEIHKYNPELPAPTPTKFGSEQGQLFQALTRWFLSLADQQAPLVMCIDDLHWIDSLTLAWLGYLARHLKQAPILILGTYRTYEAHMIDALKTDLMRQELLQEVHLTGLTQTDVLHLIRHLSGQAEGAERFSQRLHSETGGNPFFLLETLRVLFETEVLWADDTGWSTKVDEITIDYRELPIPDTLYDALKMRLSCLSSQARQVLEAGAVIGPCFAYDLVRTVSGRNQNEVIDALDELLARQLLTEVAGQYDFMHDLVRHFVFRELSYGRRQLLQQRTEDGRQKLSS